MLINPIINQNARFFHNLYPQEKNSESIAIGKEVCNRTLTYQQALVRKYRKLIYPLWSKTEMDHLGKTLIRPPNIKIIRTKFVENKLTNRQVPQYFCLN